MSLHAICNHISQISRIAYVCVCIYLIVSCFGGVSKSLDFDWFSNDIKSSSPYAHDDNAGTLTWEGGKKAHT